MSQVVASFPDEVVIIYSADLPLRPREVDFLFEKRIGFETSFHIPTLDNN
jgi:hypothetical protein